MYIALQSLELDLTKMMHMYRQVLQSFWLFVSKFFGLMQFKLNYQNFSYNLN